MQRSWSFASQYRRDVVASRADYEDQLWHAGDPRGTHESLSASASARTGSESSDQRWPRGPRHRLALAAPAQPTHPDDAQLVGTDLQGAHDAIQSVTHGKVWFSSSTDLTGQSRAQIVDRNWIVCSSTPAPGVTFTTTTAINFGVVRDTEVCPS